MEKWLQGVWYGRRSGGALLLPLAWLFEFISSMRRAAYRAGLFRSARLGTPVVVVGNITVGGTGKTPFTIWLVERLQARGLRVGVVSRGYGRATRGSVVVSPSSTARDVGDEPLLIQRRTGCDVAVAEQRVAAAEALAARGIDVLISDDGLQHLALARDVEIAVVDGARKFGNGRMLPAGPLRERPARLATVDAVIVNGGEAEGGRAPAFAMRIDALEARRVDGSEPGRPLASLSGQPVHAVAGIGHPERFFALLERAGLSTIWHPFADHHEYQPADLQFGDDAPILMTEKDAVKCTAFATSRMHYVPATAVFSPEDEQALLDIVLAKLESVR